MPSDTRLNGTAYKTILSPAVNEIIVQKSRFIGILHPASSEETALDVIRVAKKEHRTATHHCFAYVIGNNAGIMRYSDDGEPSGTAGLPIMGVLQNKGLVNLCAVVVRYFGGTLLGAGGLVRAYSSACALAVSNAAIVIMESTRRVMAHIDYHLWGKVQHALSNSSHVVVEKAEYGAYVAVTLLVRDDDVAAVCAALQDLLNQAVDLELSDSFMYHWSLGGD